MSPSLRVIVVCTALVSWLPAQAQFLGPGIEFNVTLTKQDLHIIHHTVNEQVHGKPVGTTAKWSNPKSQNSGKIRSPGNSRETASNARPSITG